MSGLAVTKHLSSAEIKLFTRVHQHHISAMGLAEREQYTVQNIIKVKRNVSEKCLEVYFKNSEWFKYFADGTWGW